MRALKACHRALGLEIDAESGASGWCGETMDYELAVSGLLDADENGPAAHAEGRIQEICFHQGGVLQTASEEMYPSDTLVIQGTRMFRMLIEMLIS